MAKLHLEKLIPSPLELGFCAVVGLTMALLGNSKSLINHYGLDTSAATISTHADSTLSQSLSKLDSYQATTTIVSFLVWALIGLLTLSILQAILRLTQEVSYDKELSSNAYVHPKDFTRARFWRYVAGQSLSTFLTVSLLATGAILYALYALPLGLIYVRVFLLDITPVNVLYGLLGWIILASGLVILAVLTRLVRWRYKLVD